MEGSDRIEKNILCRHAFGGFVCSPARVYMYVEPSKATIYAHQFSYALNTAQVLLKFEQIMI